MIERDQAQVGRGHPVLDECRERDRGAAAVHREGQLIRILRGNRLRAQGRQRGLQRVPGDLVRGPVLLRRLAGRPRPGARRSPHSRRSPRSRRPAPTAGRGDRSRAIGANRAIAGHPAPPRERSIRAWLASEAAMLASSWANEGVTSERWRTRALAASSSAACSAARAPAAPEVGGGPGLPDVAAAAAGDGERAVLAARDLDQARAEPGQVGAVLGEQRGQEGRLCRGAGNSGAVPGDHQLLGGDRVVKHGDIGQRPRRGAECSDALAPGREQRKRQRGGRENVPTPKRPRG